MRRAAASPLDPYVSAVRHFNRFYTRKIGVLKEGLLDSSLSLTEARVLYESCNRSRFTATDLRGALGLDAGYLSRILRAFEKRGWLERTPAEADARRHVLASTRSGRAAFESLNARSNDEIRGLLSGIERARLERLRQAMQAAWRRRVGRLPPRRPLLPGMGLRRAIRGAGRADRRRVRAAFRTGGRAVLDCREGRRAGRFGVPGARVEARREAATAARRAVRPRPRNRQAPGRGVHPLCPAMPVPQDRLVDAERAASRPQDLPGDRVPTDRHGAAPQLGPR